MSKTPRFLLDTAPLIQAKRTCYGFDFCPAFWEMIERGYQRGYVLSIDRVKSEINKGKDELTDWSNQALPDEFFISSRTVEVTQQFAKLMSWVQSQNQFTDAAKNEFAGTDVADGWLIATALSEQLTLVTQEVFDPHIKKKVPIPNVCRQFGVSYMDTYEFIRNLKATFILKT